MTTNNSLRQKLTATQSIEIVPQAGLTKWPSPMWAINWFNQKRPWLYTLYTLLAAHYVGKAGARLLIKASFKSFVGGNKDWGRSTLLIVSYPAASNFLKAIANKGFQIISLLRIKAVEKFVFGFMQQEKLHVNTSLPDTGNLFLVVHYAGQVNQDALGKVLEQQNIRLFFEGHRVAQLKRIVKGNTEATIPFFMEGTLLFSGNSLQHLEEAYAATEFLELRKQFTHHYAAIFKRTK